MSKSRNWFTCGRASCNAETLRQIAGLIYQTDPYIYPFWRSNIDDFVDLIVPYMEDDRFIFSHRNIYIARESNSKQPLGVLVALSDKNLDFDYGVFDDEQSRFVIDNYLQEVIHTRQTLPEHRALLVNLCVDPSMRGYGIGSQLLYEYIWRGKVRGINDFQLDCLQDNGLASQMYQKMGFVIIDSNKYGFDGTDDPQVKLHTMLYTF